jgi:hypothetical protein
LKNNPPPFPFSVEHEQFLTEQSLINAEQEEEDKLAHNKPPLIEEGDKQEVKLEERRVNSRGELSMWKREGDSL